MILAQDLPYRFSGFAQYELGAERILWAGAPGVRSRFLASFLIWIFALPWTAFALFWEGTALAIALHPPAYDHGGPPDMMRYVMALFGLPFVFIGLAMMSAPFWVLQTARRTFYIITEKRVLCLVARREMAVQSIYGRDILDLSRSERPGGHGTLTISLGFARDSDGDRVEKTHTLTDIPDVALVERHVRSLMQQARA